jgi:hypothetical protein
LNLNDTVLGQAEHVQTDRYDATRIGDGAHRGVGSSRDSRGGPSGHRDLGGAVTSRRLTPAEETAAILQEAAHGGMAVMIPGALEPRGGRPDIRPANVTTASVTSHTQRAVMGDRERFEYEREGGGAPRERPSGRRETMWAQLWHCLGHPAELSTLWHLLLRKAERGTT